MSLEVTLIPLALVIINVIDKDYYESWIRNKRAKKVTSYERLEEFIYDLNQLGYKYDIQQGTVRICSPRKSERYYFSRINHQWVLSFSEYDSKENVSIFLQDLERVSKGKVSAVLPNLLLSSQNDKSSTVNYNTIPPLSSNRVHFFPTIFQDTDVLKDALNRLGISYSTKGDDLEYIKDGVKCTFIKDEDGKYVFRTVGNVSEEELFRALIDIDIVYKKDVQKKAYDSVISKLPNYNMTLSNEIRTEDDTIILTINVE